MPSFGEKGLKFIFLRLELSKKGSNAHAQCIILK